MPRQLINNVVIKGIACAVPRRRETERELARAFGEKQASRLVAGTGVRERRIDHTICTSDLCVAAAEALLKEGCVDRSEIKHVVFVSQTPDYFLPATACLIQNRLGLSSDCSAFDVNQGCAGYTYGLWVASRLLRPGESVLLLAGDTSSRMCQPTDRSTVPLFGEAGSATLLSYSEAAPTIAFAAGTDGTGASNIMVEDGSFRRQSECLKDAAGDGVTPGCGLGSASLKMNGAEVFSFSLQKVPPLVEQCIATAGWSLEDCGDIVFHQANGFMLNTLAEKIGIPACRVPKSLEYFGNTSSASIPMTLVTQRREALRGEVGRYVLAGFGVGWSWAGIAAEIGGITVPELVEVE